MKVLELDTETVYRITGDPYLYEAVTFLDKLRQPTSNLHAKFRHCTTCMQNSRISNFKIVANALVALILAESNLPYGQLPKLKDAINKILKTDVQEILVRYKKDGQDKEFRF